MMKPSHQLLAKLELDTIICGDNVSILRTFPEACIDMCVTSPPYFGLRDYGHEGQIGLEETPELYVAKLIEVFREVWRVMKDDGTLWLNLGDTYAGSQQTDGTNNISENGKSQPHVNRAKDRSTDKWSYSRARAGNGIKPKDLIGIPWMVAFALRADGWYLRSDIIWQKPNPMPESVRDRPTKSHEYIFLLAKSDGYYYDIDAIRETQDPSSFERLKHGWNGNGDRGYPNGPQNHLKNYMDKTNEEIENLKGRNKRDVWTVNTQPYNGAHFAVFPSNLIKPCILAGSHIGGVVLDPFFGSGTTGLVARELGRSFIGIEINSEYCDIARKRVAGANVPLPGLV